ncbi:MAG TPA: glycosyltransferase family 87 protein [Candidatus Rifleibacterium sp.]|nr:glycosyltransferase family 87 protein [Candidatus Rifleibacterium sp.]HPT44289.1 glycosyltransferase family 87 protein [Candidatus Rifleibacterium sp.]
MVDKSQKLSWQSRDLIATIMLIMSVLSLLQTGNSGIQGFIAATDKPSAIYGDFHDYYYPAGRMISRVAQPLGGYFYTPSFALLLPPFTPDSYELASIRWQLLQHFGIFLLLFVPAIWLAARGGRKIWFFLYLLIFLLSFPLWHNLKWGQMSVIITMASIAALLLHERGHYWFAAMALTVAILIKYYPALFVIYFIIRKDFAFIGRMALCLLLAGFVFPASILGAATTIEFYRLVNAELAYAFDWVAFDPNSQFLPNVALRVIGIDPESSLRGFLSLPGLAVCLAMFWRMRRLASGRQHDHILTASGIFLLYPLLINTSWPHYFIYLPFCAVILLQNTTSCWQKAVIFIAIMLQSCLIVPFTGHLWYSGKGLLLAANLLLLAIWFKKTSPGSDPDGQTPEVF